MIASNIETSKPTAPVHKQSKPVQKPESESDSSDSETELFYPRYMLPEKRQHRSNINESKSVSSIKEVPCVSSW